MSGRTGRRRIFDSVVMIAVGFAAFVAGLVLHQSYSPYAHGTSTVGTITDVRSGKDNDGDTWHTAVYTFTTTDGRKVSFEDPATSSNRPTLGATVEISYLPASPERARRIPGFDWFGWTITAAGAVFVVIGILNLLRALLGATSPTSSGAAPPRRAWRID